MDLQIPLSRLKGVGPSFAKRLEKLELVTVNDLIYHFPFRYEDFSKNSKIAEANLGEVVTFQGQIWSVQNTFTKFRKVLTKAILNDGSGSVELTWFNQSWLTKTILTGDTLQISGKLDQRGNTLTITAPEWEKVDLSPGIHTGRLVPIYPETYGISSKWFRKTFSLLMPLFLSSFVDPLPDSIRDEMLPLGEAIRKIHFPDNIDQVELAKKRLSFDELFEIQLMTQKIRLEWKKDRVSKALIIDQARLNNFYKSLPFELTAGQKKVTEEIIQDLRLTQPMNRLLQGEVGSGKTVVAAIAIYLTFLNDQNSLLMAPTEILAFQHYKSLKKLLEPLGIKVAIYTGSRKFTKVSQKDTPDSVDSPHLIVGTHALLSEKLAKENIGLVVIDEQQRFGVEQRSLLRNSTETVFPHFLTMTATPIPRTVALTLYGDLDISTIGELPPGRQVVKTHLVPSFKRLAAYDFIAKKVAEGDQVYVVTPLIEESETLISAKAVKKEFEDLQKIFPKFKLGLLHGRLKPKEKEAAINSFKEKEVDILVSTSVVEVGVDVPNATIMVIEGAERFGLSALHQLRGRVGRGKKQSFCFLFSGEEDSSSINRLRNLESINDGLKLSEIDLKMRGSGQVFGTRQSGRWNLKIATLTDLGQIEKAKFAAREILSQDPNLDKYPYYRGKLPNLEKVTPD